MLPQCNNNNNDDDEHSRECKRPPKYETKVIRDSNPDFRINQDPDLDVHQICPKMLWMYYLVDVSHIAKYGTNRSLIV